MAMIDYGVVVKKNGKIITDPKGDLFQNYTALKCVDDEIEVEKFDEKIGNYTEYIPGPNYIDETIVKAEDDYGKIRDYSMAHNYMALIGDEKFLIGFYKCGFKIAINKESFFDQNKYGVKGYYQHFWTQKRKKPLKMSIDYQGIHYTDIAIELIDRDHNDKLKATFIYNNDKYEVVYGYAIDPSPKYLYGKKSYLAPHRDYWNKRIYHKKADCRRLLRRLKTWYEN